MSNNYSNCSESKVYVACRSYQCQLRLKGAPITHGAGRRTKIHEKDHRWSGMFWASDKEFNPSSGQIRRLAGFEKICILYVAMAKKTLLCRQKSFFGHCYVQNAYFLPP